MDALWPYVAALVPTIVVAAFFYAIMKRIVEGDRRERLAQRRFEDAQDADRRTDRDQTPPADRDGGEANSG